MLARLPAPQLETVRPHIRRLIPMSGVYAIVHTNTGMRYVGSAQRDIQRRRKEHERGLERSLDVSQQLPKSVFPEIAFVLSFFFPCGYS